MPPMALLVWVSPQVLANELASATAATRLPTSALPVPARSSAVPWSTEVRMMGSPSVTFTPAPKPTCFSTGRPWSWNMASTASAWAKALGVKAVSAGSGPKAAIPAARAMAMAGAMTAVSSCPRCPPSPACGFKPSTAIRGLAIPKRVRKLPSRICSVCNKPSCVMASGTARSGRCVVANATRKVSATSSITTGQAFPVASANSSAKNSVWPVNGMPASAMTDFCTGAVTMAATSPAAAASAAARSMARTAGALRESSCPGTTCAATGKGQQ